MLHLQQSAREKSSSVQQRLKKQKAWISTQPSMHTEGNKANNIFLFVCVRSMAVEKQPVSRRQKYLEHKVPEKGEPGRRKALQKLYEQNRCWGSNMKQIQYPMLTLCFYGLCLFESLCTQDYLRTKACWAKTQSCKAFSGAGGSSRTYSSRTYSSTSASSSTCSRLKG